MHHGRVGNAGDPQRTLVRRASRGDHDAFSDLVRPRIPRLYGLAGLVTGDPGAAEDVTQEALLRAWRDLPALRDPDRFDPWLRRLVVNASRDEGRRRRRRGRPVPIEQAPEPRVTDGLDVLAQRDELAAGFRTLTPDERSTLALRYYLDLSTADAARTAGVGEIAFRSRVHRALAKLRDAIGSARPEAVSPASGAVAGPPSAPE